jgi:radical SAM protein with 4Fe4S-binding SPASM domain
MIDVTFLYCGKESGSTGHRYGRGKDLRGNIVSSAGARKPIVVWNVTRACNLNCRHCYSRSNQEPAQNELSTDEAKRVLDDLSVFAVPVVLFSGGEPLLRNDIFELLGYARNKKLKTVLSTNGTLIDDAIADKIKTAQTDYVGISLDSPDPQSHNMFRGQLGSFEKTIFGIRRLTERNQKVGLRITLNKINISQIDSFFELAQREKIPRMCFYHLVPAGRGAKELTVSPKETRHTVERILECTEQSIQQGTNLEVLTVDGHYDGPLIYLKLKQRNDPRAEEVRDYLEWNGGGVNSTGVGIACIDWEGSVHPDQFWMDYSLGNIREKSFGELWTDESDQLLHKLRRRKEFITGRCSMCQFFNLCGGSLRARAKNITCDLWASDPGCTLDDSEIFPNFLNEPRP